MDENMQPIVVHNEKSNPSSPQHTRHSEQSETQPTTNNKQLTREVLLQKQRELQQLHYQQTQTLLNKHQDEKLQLTEYQRMGKLDPNSASQLLLQMEETHDLELKRLQDEQQVEQSELMDLIFDSAAAVTSGSGGDKEKKQSPPPPQPKQQKNTKALWNKAAVSAVAAKTMSSQKIDDYDHVQHQGEERAEEQYEQQPAVSDTNETYVAPWNRKKESEKKKKMEGGDEQPDVSETPESYVAPWNRKKKVETTHQAETTPRVTNSSTDMPDKVPPTLPNLESQQPTITKAPPLPSDKQRRAEVQAVMRDKTLDKAEKQKKLAEIKAKYAAQSTPQVKKQSLTVDTQEQTPVTAAQSRWKRGAASAVAAKGLTNNFQAMKKTEGSTTPIIVFIRKLKQNDPSLTTIILDGRKDVSENEWVDLFDAIEENTYLTHLSVSDCGLDDDVTTPLVLALVENETVTQLDLSNNPKLTNSTGKSLLKILKQSNQVLKKLNIIGTTISDKTSDKVQECLDDRDDIKKLEKIQAARQQKIKELLAFSASDDVSPSSERLSQRLLEIENEGDEEDREFAKSINTKSTNSSGEDGNTTTATSKKGKKPRKRRVTMEKTNSSKSMNSTGSGNSSRSSTPTQHSLKSAVRATTMARQMANMGGEITNVGLNIEQVKQTRKMRGECEDCGQKCFNKTMFKTIPLTIVGKVEDGRCLRCTT